MVIAMEKPPVKNARECIPPSKVIISSGPNFAHSKKVRIFGPERAKYAPKSAFLVSVDQKIGLSSLFTAMPDQKRK